MIIYRKYIPVKSTSELVNEALHNSLYMFDTGRGHMFLSVYNKLFEDGTVPDKPELNRMFKDSIENKKYYKISNRIESIY